MTNKTQTELEQPAKVYQLDAVERKVEQALDKLDTIVNSVSGVVTNSHLEARLKEQGIEFSNQMNTLEQKMSKSISSEVQKIHLKYNPTYKGIWWVVGTLATCLIGLLFAQLNNFWRGS